MIGNAYFSSVNIDFYKGLLLVYMERFRIGLKIS